MAEENEVLKSENKRLTDDLKSTNRAFNARFSRVCMLERLIPAGNHLVWSIENGTAKAQAEAVKEWNAAKEPKP
jgi:cell shape-determining protein MreC